MLVRPSGQFTPLACMFVSCPHSLFPSFLPQNTQSPRKMNAKLSSAILFAALPRALQLTCLTMLSLEDILAIGATSHDMRQLCADDVAWRAIYEDLTTRCGLQGIIGYTSAQKQRSLENRKKRVEQQQANYKHKTFLTLFDIFR